MKKFFSFAMMSAVALTGAMLFTACASEDDVQAPVNPTFDGEAVKTSFTISVADVKGATRMSTESTQAQSTPVFQGMTDVYLFPSKTAFVESPTPTAFTEGYINLPDFGDFDTNVYGANGKIYKDVTFSLGVTDFLFYGAIKNNRDNGELKPSYLKMVAAGTPTFTPDWAAEPLQTTSTVADITFDLVPYQKDMNLTGLKGDAAAITTIGILNGVDGVIATQISGLTDNTPEKDALLKIQKELRNDVAQGGDPADYKEYAGSSVSLKYLMELLYNNIKFQEATLTSAVANAVIAEIEKSFTATPIEDGHPEKGYTLAWGGTGTVTDPGFPTNLGLPDGAVAVQFDGTDTFEFVEVESSDDAIYAYAAGKYTHPARLYYTVNTKAMVRDAEWLDNTGHNTANWETIKAADGTTQYTEEAIKATTHSVIMKDQVQYAVARLDVQARVKPDVTIKDAGSNKTGAADHDPQPVIVPAAGYTLTGVLIGGQKQVDWQFKPVGTEEYVIYDNKMTDYDSDANTNDISALQGTAYSNINHTLVLETAASDKVRIALEFVNNGNAFYGRNHNIIPAGSKFYLIAELDPTVAATITGNPDNLTQVFKQDYTTLAKLTINETSLASAYNVIPDLRSPKLEFGLSVNLEWKVGITFEKEF
jgi:hypothetical protein